MTCTPKMLMLMLCLFAIAKIKTNCMPLSVVNDTMICVNCLDAESAANAIHQIDIRWPSIVRSLFSCAPFWLEFISTEMCTISSPIFVRSAIVLAHILAHSFNSHFCIFCICTRWSRIGPCSMHWTHTQTERNMSVACTLTSDAVAENSLDWCVSNGQEQTSMHYIRTSVIAFSL